MFDDNDQQQDASVFSGGSQPLGPSSLPPEYNQDLTWEDKQQLAKGGWLSSDEERMYGVKNWKKPVQYGTKVCPLCGGENDANADKCQYCGTSLKGTSPT
jgi:hypothetical protein